MQENWHKYEKLLSYNTIEKFMNFEHKNIFFIYTCAIVQGTSAMILISNSKLKLL